MNKKDNKRDDNKIQAISSPKGTKATRSPKNADSAPKPTSPSGGKLRHIKRGRKVKFADPIYKQLLYEKANQDAEQVDATSTLEPAKHKSTLNDLRPPLSLVAQLDLAARKLEARKTTKNTDELAVKTNHDKSLKSIPADKDLKSIELQSIRKT